MKQTAFIGLVAGIVVLAGCTGGPSETPTTTEPSGEPSLASLVPEGSTHFIVLGDTGMGNDAQKRVSGAVEQVCREKGCNFALINGDNIYSVGVRHEFDPQFESKFEVPYRNVDLPFYLVLGNHDNGDGDGSKPAVGDYQVLYSQRTDRSSDKWHMPGRYYSFSSGDVSFIGLDSGPSEVSQAQVWQPGSRGAVMQDWVASEVTKLTTKWRFAFAHHPYISNAIHGDAGMYDNSVGRGLPYKLMLEENICGNVQVFFAGHDHSLQWLPPVGSCGATQFIVSGAGGASIYAKGAAPESPTYFEDYQSYGFFYVDVTGDTFTGTAYDENANILFERSFTI